MIKKEFSEFCYRNVGLEEEDVEKLHGGRKFYNRMHTYNNRIIELFNEYVEESFTPGSSIERDSYTSIEDLLFLFEDIRKIVEQKVYELVNEEKVDIMIDDYDHTPRFAVIK
jgi:hypothetical protein